MKKTVFVTILTTVCCAFIIFNFVNVLADPPPGKGKNKNLYPIDIPQTGQTNSYATGDDGDLQMGIAWPNPRFTDNEDGTVTDNLTGLMWLKDATCIATNYLEFDSDDGIQDGEVSWQNAFDFIVGINNETYANCGAGYTDWRFPNVRELQSLIHYGFYYPALPNTAGTGRWSEGDPFTGLQFSDYWSATTNVEGSFFSSDFAYHVRMVNGYVRSDDKSVSNYVLPVRGPE